ncbi:MAG TPA: dihydropteroate synthase [Thermodesulfobacteriota bacterium]|nr:dihydropteroate synthase [Thermodesulfobacteriota bacterium]
MSRYTPRLIHVSRLDDIVSEIGSLGFRPDQAEVVSCGLWYRLVRVDGLDHGLAERIQKVVQASGGMAVFSARQAADETAVDMLLAASQSGLTAIASDPGLRSGPLRDLSESLSEVLQFESTPHTLTLKGKVFDLSQRTHIMGVLNITPDSFSDGGRYWDHAQAVEQARRMIDEGADIIDVGGESTRPGATPVSADEELCRIIPVIEEIAADAGVLVSVDTMKAVVAKQALAAGAAMINDVSSLSRDPSLAEVVAESGVPIVLMHMRGTPQTMQQCTAYEDLMGEICDYLRRRMEYAEKAGIRREQIVIDPGIGFGKSLERGNLTILRNLAELRSLGRPILIGPSRKGFLGRIVGRPAHDRAEATAGAVAAAVMNGADLVRVHDVGMMKQVVAVIDAIKRAAPVKTVKSEK